MIPRLAHGDTLVRKIEALRSSQNGVIGLAVLTPLSQHGILLTKSYYQESTRETRGEIEKSNKAK